MSRARLWFRVLLDRGAMGPGKAALLDAVARTGSIAAAGREMKMSYRRAWRLVGAMNQLFDTPLVETERGGEAGGGSRLTAEGEAVLGIYRKIERELDAAAGTLLDELARMGRVKSSLAAA